MIGFLVYFRFQSVLRLRPLNPILAKEHHRKPVVIYDFGGQTELIASALCQDARSTILPRWSVQHGKTQFYFTFI